MPKIGSTGGLDKQMKKMNDRIQKINDKGLDEFIEQLARKLAIRVLVHAIPRTPVDTGTLRRGWGGGVEKTPTQIGKEIPVNKVGDVFSIVISNNIDYAVYVEYGHRARGGKGWVPGKFMLKISVEKVKAKSRSIIEKEFKKQLERIFK